MFNALKFLFYITLAKSSSQKIQKSACIVQPHVTIAYLTFCENENPVNPYYIRMNAIRRISKISKPEISKEYSISEATVKRTIDALKKRGLIKRIGSNKGGYWKIEKNEPQTTLYISVNNQIMIK